jgi:hypothetical protein
MLQPDGQGTPYQIVAAQVMLARWAGIPARIGFGFDGGTFSHGLNSFYPDAGAAWMEAYFQGYGWVPIVGTPQKSTSTLTPHRTRQTPATSNRLDLQIAIPVSQFSPHLIYEVVRYYSLRALAVLAPLLLIFSCYPVLLKAIRRGRRRRWTAGRGAPARAAVAYADLRERLHDLNIGSPRATPLQFLLAVEADTEHSELAWLVTRLLWGDLRRDTSEEHGRAAEEMCESVYKRIVGEQPMLNRLVAAITRTSLRDPWCDDIPGIAVPRRMTLSLPARPRRMRRLRTALAGRA